MFERLNALRARHGIIEAKITRETIRPKPDGLRLTALKKMRLRLKEDIHLIEQKLVSLSPQGERMSQGQQV